MGLFCFINCSLCHCILAIRNESFDAIGHSFQQFQMADFQHVMQVLAILIKLPFIGLQQFLC